MPEKTFPLPIPRVSFLQRTKNNHPNETPKAFLANITQPIQKMGPIKKFSQFIEKRKVGLQPASKIETLLPLLFPIIQISSITIPLFSQHKIL